MSLATVAVYIGIASGLLAIADSLARIVRWLNRKYGSRPEPSGAFPQWTSSDAGAAEPSFAPGYPISRGYGIPQTYGTPHPYGHRKPPKRARTLAKSGLRPLQDQYGLTVLLIAVG